MEDHLLLQENKCSIFQDERRNIHFRSEGTSGTCICTDCSYACFVKLSIATARSYKYLGVTLDDRLTMIPHMHETLSKVSRTADLISRLVRRDHLPSFPIIQTLVKCVLIPQMIYGFPFLQFSNKAVSTRQVTGGNTQCSFLMRLKNSIMRPLLYVLGLPHSSHHASVFIESRLHNIRTLHTLTSARLAHRWLSLNDTNEAAVMFRNHITRYGTGNACSAHEQAGLYSLYRHA